MEIEGVPLSEFRTMPSDELDALLAFGRPITFHLGSAEVLAEFNQAGDMLTVNLAHIDGGGEGVLAVFWKTVAAVATERGFTRIVWNVHALTCANPNPRLQRFLKERGFIEVDSEPFGRVLTFTEILSP